MCLILSHVESGFSTNEQILDHNMKKLVAQHIEGIQSKRGVLKVDIHKQLLSCVQGAHTEYSYALEENKKMQMAGEK